MVATRNDGAGSDSAAAELDRIRTDMDVLDGRLIELIAERLQLARVAEGVKRRAGLPVLDPAREALVVRRAATLAREAGVPEEEARSIFWQLVGLCRREQIAGHREQ
ncbi:MAG: chorismate mutase [Gemmatimonadaceae bacterium]